MKKKSNQTKGKQMVMAAMALSLMTPAIVAPITVDAATYSKTFKDVSPNNANYDIIHKMAEQGIISGYEDGTFRPNETLTRKHAAALINRAVKNLPKNTTFKAPKDLSTNNAYFKDMKNLMEAGLLELDSKGNIYPNKPLTRGEMAKILNLAYRLDMEGVNPLKDVSLDMAIYVQGLYKAKITTGYEDKTFRENESLTRAHYATFIYRAEEKAGDNKDSIFAKSYIGQYEPGKVPLPTKYQGIEPRKVFETQAAEFEKFKSSMVKGSFKVVLSAGDAVSYNTVLNKISKVTGLAPEQIAKYVDDSAKTGKTIYFKAENNQEFFIIYSYYFGGIHTGEVHHK